jgi:hypothetical protein
MSPNTLPSGVLPIYTAIVTNIVDPLMALLFAIGLLLFVWGLVEFLWNYNKGETQNEGKKHMFWGVIGMFIMVGAYGIIQYIIQFFPTI